MGLRPYTDAGSWMLDAGYRELVLFRLFTIYLSLFTVFLKPEP